MTFADSVAARSRIRLMMGHRQVEQAALFYEFSLEPKTGQGHPERKPRRSSTMSDPKRIIPAEPGWQVVNCFVRCKKIGG
jgi:hypothetical protein